MNKVESRAHLFGIRHHGPGSAASLLAALEELDPALVLIEGAPEAEVLVPYAALPGMKPPLAILHYQADNPANALFAPFAEYSPEWQALRWSLARRRPVRFIDWPAACALAVADQQASGEDAPGSIELSDPLDRLAEISGYADGEAWWNALIESSKPGPDVFVAIESAMTELRSAGESEGVLAERRVQRDIWREAFMRLAIMQALKDEPGTVAVIVGAWHLPALRGKKPIADDMAIVRAVPKVKVESAWVPWSDSRLAAASGYGAGVTAPGWYSHLWRLHRESNSPTAEAFAAGWQSRVSGLLRSEGLAVASASTIEAVRLSIALAAIRGNPAPGLAEMHDATLAALCHGDEAPLRLIEQRLLWGERVGVVDENVPQMPLAQDLDRWQKRCRLKPEDLEREISLDLRTEAGLLKSTLLHRLALLDVEWGRLLEGEAGRGTFRETWLLAWSPILSVKLAEALVYGVTIEQAASNKATAECEGEADVARLAELVRACLLADLPQAADRCIERLQAAAVSSGDIAKLMLAVPALVSILRYGTARPIPQEQLANLVGALAAEVNAGALAASSGIEADEAQALRRAMASYDHAISLFGDGHLRDMWQRELALIAASERAAPAVSGLALRQLHNRQAWSVEAVAAALSRALTPPAPPAAAGPFVESFLAGSAEVLVQDQPLLAALDQWLSELDEESFIELLPVLRRGFADFAGTGRKRILQLVGSGAASITVENGRADASAPVAAFEQALPLLRTILGIPA